jgi:hypothetical protein
MVELVDALETHDYTARFLAPLDQAEQTALAGALGKLFATTPEGRRMTRGTELVRSEGK